MKKELEINGIPAVLWGVPSRKLYFMYMVREDVKKKRQYSQTWLAVSGGRFLA